MCVCVCVHWLVLLAGVLVGNPRVLDALQNVKTAKASDVVAVGDKIDVRVIDVDRAARKVGLCLSPHSFCAAVLRLVPE